MAGGRRALVAAAIQLQRTHYTIRNAILEPKPVHKPGHAGGESETAKNLIAERATPMSCTAPAERLAPKIADMTERRERLAPEKPPLQFGVAGFVVCRPSEEAARRELARITDVKATARGFANYEQWLSGTQLEQHVSLEDYSVSNRGLRTGLVGTPSRSRYGSTSWADRHRFTPPSSARRRGRWSALPRK
jgi:FMNH2-dependent dimethyl sulfone monooxygenase